MLNLALNGNPSPDHNHQNDSTTVSLNDGHLRDEGGRSPDSHQDQVLEDTADDQIHRAYADEPPLKRRKLTDTSGGEGSHRSSPRAPSPPWKKFIAEGPTSFVEGGRRKSGRTNLLPLEQQPQSSKRQTRAYHDKMIDKQTKPSYSVKVKPKMEGGSAKNVTAVAGQVPKRGPGRPPKIKVEDGTKSGKVIKGRSPGQFVGKKTRQHVVSPLTNSNMKDGSSDTDTPSPGPPTTLQKVRFRVALPKPSVMTPANVPPPKKYASFQEFFEKDEQEPFAGQESLNYQQIHFEANARHRVYEARRNGQLRPTSDSAAPLEKQVEPIRQFAHHDHLLRHICHFRNLLRQERKDHLKKAEQLAHEAKKYVEDKQKRGRVKPAEEIALEYVGKMRIQYRAVVKDLEKLWSAVEAEVNAGRVRQYEEEQQEMIKGHLNRVLDRTDRMLQRAEQSGDESAMDVDVNSQIETEQDISSSDSEDISDSSSDSGIDVQPDDPDSGLDAEELQAKYGNLPEIEENVAIATLQEDFLSETGEGSDPETEMDSELDSERSDGSDENSDEQDEDEDDDDEDDESAGGSLLSLLFSKKQISEMANSGVAEPEQQSQGALHRSDMRPIIEDLTEPMAVDQPIQISLESHLNPLLTVTTPEIVNEPLSAEPSMQTSPQTSVSKRAESESASSVEPRQDSQPSEIPRDDKTSGITPIPSLLRGTLREYQHEGLDWLANLYATGRSGILADEMGLGKTIQSIALLAHLATRYEVWGPHLIVVPTSVMLNWEMEFKKFLPGFKILTYYGSLEERKQKRRGWMADDSFNVCITSYQLVLQDANSFKRRRWHYMILDEAHNIKNFRSERWQTMMTFNTRARLLLTGTPLQNNLTELWSLLFFLHYGQEGQDDDDAFAGLKEWSEWFKRPVESILEHGKQVLDAEDKEQVAKLHKVIRPFLLRRLKANVEKQMPLKYEHVELCRLSKRQRQLYDGFMSRAQTKETLASGNYLTIINALMQLRKVCNHPDLFETRPINTSFAMTKSVTAGFEVQDLLVRRKLFAADLIDKIDLDFLRLVPISNEKISSIENLETLRRHAYPPIKALRDCQSTRLDRQAIPSSHSQKGIITSLENIGRRARLQELDRTVYYEAYKHHQRTIWGRGLIEKLDFGTTHQKLSRYYKSQPMTRFWEADPPLAMLDMVQSIENRSEKMQPLVQQYACLTPAVIAMDVGKSVISEVDVVAARKELARIPDPFHQARMKLSIAFPDKRLLQYDCGKLQRLAKLLRDLQAGGHRALIFTQMTKVLDLLEQFLNIHGHRYLRLDGATKIEQRQILTDRFNNDTRILAFILSSRSGGLGINLTGADTVIFYDLDWNPAMDKQCTDRAHRIGQTRDVHIYRFVSEHTIESNILRKANQKQLLDDVVIQEGDFTTDYRTKVTYRDMLDEHGEDDVAGAAMDRVLGNDTSAVAAFEQAEDKEDVSAAQVATKEVQHADEGDFEEKVAVAMSLVSETQTVGPFDATEAAIMEIGHDAIHHIDEYLLKMQTYLLKDVALALPKLKSKRGRRRGDEHRRRRQR